MSTGKKTKPSYFNAISGIALVLFLMGLLGWLLINGRNLSRAFKEDLEISVDLHDNTTDANIQKLQAILAKQPFVREAKIITKDEALKMENQVEGLNMVELLGKNPLYASIATKLHEEYINKDSLEKFRKFAMQSNIVRAVTWQTVVVDQMDSLFRKISLILGGISVLLLMVVIILIDNTVRLAMFSNRFLIKTMQMVGATRFFITRPFDIRAIINGFAGGVIAVVSLWVVISLAIKQLPELSLLYDKFLLGILMVGMVTKL
ncbi:MAG: cell division protein FtsX [Chitinophagia bacterium]|nr:cell division protein FtsX [Chitinophagia bacterium]